MEAQSDLQAASAERHEAHEQSQVLQELIERVSVVSQYLPSG